MWISRPEDSSVDARETSGRLNASCIIYAGFQRKSGRGRRQEACSEVKLEKFSINRMRDYGQNPNPFQMLLMKSVKGITAIVNVVIEEKTDWMGKCSILNIFSFKTSKRSPFLLRLVLFFFVMAFGVYICSVCLKQIPVQVNPENMVSVTGLVKASCDIDGIPHEETRFVHFPRPKNYSRGECACAPVRFFVILSMQRSGSGWFETLLNSHPNISSNGEIFSLKQRRSNISSILSTLDSVYSLDWISSAAKNDCVAAVGFKWMLNQAVMVNHQQIVNYFNWKGVSVLFLFRRNLLRRLISLMANDYDREAKLLNGTHKSHVHTKEEAEILAQFKPKLNISNLIPGLNNFQRIMDNSLQKFNSTRHLILYYEDLINNQKVLCDVQEFLRVPIRKLQSHQVKIHTRPPSEQVENWEDVYRMLKGTQAVPRHPEIYMELDSDNKVTINADDMAIDSPVSEAMNPNDMGDLLRFPKLTPGAGVHQPLDGLLCLPSKKQLRGNWA
ncbi:hypothetical protein NE237_010019 [Protea cynaroides]|uniref:Sulfotransferase n=1 Tax=Protea cynaroides TaxID=273540 RepID=A0A9Q0KZN3_9MAGN|nr:hypothetical protein NE237_010019 [Protea cynaroides]